MINWKAVRMSPDEKVFQFLDTLLPAAENMQFVESRSSCAADADIGMPSLRVLKAPVDGKLAAITIKAANPLATMADPVLLRFLYRSLRDDALASDPDALNDLGWLWINGSRVLFDSVLARRLFKLAAVVDGEGRVPRVHDLRHSFAVQTLIRAYRGQGDPQALLPKLALYLGHVSIESTIHYLRLVPAVARLASSRFEAAFGRQVLGEQS